MQKSARPLLVEGSTFPALPFFLVGLVATAVLAYLSTEAAETGNSTLIVGAYGFPLVCFGVMVVASAWLLADPTRYEFYENGFKVRNREPGAYLYSDIEAWWPSESDTTVWIKIFESDDLIHMTSKNRTPRGSSALVDLLDKKGESEGWVKVDGVGTKAELPTTPEIQRDIRRVVLTQNAQRRSAAQARWFGRVWSVGFIGLVAVLFGAALALVTVLGLFVFIAGAAFLVLDYVLVWPHYADARSARVKTDKALLSSPS